MERRKELVKKEYKQRGGNPLNNDKLVNEAVNDAITKNITYSKGLDRGFGRRLRFVFNIGGTIGHTGKKKIVTTSYLVAYKKGLEEIMDCIIKEKATYENSNELSEGHQHRLEQQEKLYSLLKKRN